MSTGASSKPASSRVDTRKGIISHQVEDYSKMVTPAGDSIATQRLSDSEDGSERGWPSSPPTSPTQEPHDGNMTKHIQAVQATTSYSSFLEQRYVKLAPGCMDRLVWSNNPRDLDLYGAFSEDKPNLSSDFNVKGLKPVIKEEKGDRFILMDTDGFYYLWNPWEGLLWRVSDEWTRDEDLDGSVESIVKHLLSYYIWVQEEAKQVVKDYATGSYMLV